MLFPAVVWHVPSNWQWLFLVHHACSLVWGSFRLKWCRFGFVISLPLPTIRQHLSYDDCLEDEREDYWNWSVLYCVTQCVQSYALWCVQFLQVSCFMFRFWVFARASSFLLGLLFVFCVFPLCCLVASMSAIDCLERLVSEMAYYVSCDIKLYTITRF